ncbi:MAG: sigma-70 family RNA polymerase sigma factor [Sedimentisphaerales bacterium]|nr:sigma-70 family RNA polymerase sigma factor [Sedimentisphaerales bacterium]
MNDKDSINELNLMKRIASGEIDAFSEIVKKYQDKILSLAYRFLNDWSKAEDITQEAFLRIYKSAGTYTPQARFSTWLYRIVVNLCMDEQRKQSKAPISIEEITNCKAADPESNSLERKETVELVKKAINELPERQRLAVILHRYENLSYDQICEVTQWSKSAVESLLVRAYANLREKLKKIEK